jgi:DNA-3-methyladenine glycosylase I
MAPMMDAPKPKNDSEYFDRLSMSIFTAGLNWRVVDKKWPSFKKAFLGFNPLKVAKMSESQVRSLMKDTGIVRNERKIRATVENAKTMLELSKEFGSFGSYVDSFGKNEDALQSELQERFRHLGPSTARTFLWMVGYPLTPTREERAWMKGHHAGR